MHYINALRYFVRVGHKLRELPRLMAMYRRLHIETLAFHAAQQNGGV